MIKLTIKNLKLKTENGYTLIELLAVVMIFAVIGGVISGIIFSTFRGASKTRITTDVTQNGEYAISVISNIIADSRNVLAVGANTIDNCTQVPTSNSSITLKRMDGGTTVIACENLNGVDTIASTDASLINTSNLKVTNCSFSCTQAGLSSVAPDPYAIPIVNVSFTVQNKAGTVEESQGSTTFKTSSSLRVYSP